MTPEQDIFDPDADMLWDYCAERPCTKCTHADNCVQHHPELRGVDTSSSITTTH